MSPHSCRIENRAKITIVDGNKTKRREKRKTQGGDIAIASNVSLLTSHYIQPFDIRSESSYNAACLPHACIQNKYLLHILTLINMGDN